MSNWPTHLKTCPTQSANWPLQLKNVTCLTGAPKWPFKCLDTNSCHGSSVKGVVQKLKFFETFANRRRTPAPLDIFLAPPSGHICHKLYFWRIDCHVETFWEILGIFGKSWRKFATIYAHSCGEKFSPKVHLWRKNANMRSGCSDRWLPTSCTFGYIHSHLNYYVYDNKPNMFWKSGNNSKWFLNK